jgi:pimeloyl-ACP methyl ester carboxylesterase
VEGTRVFFAFRDSSALPAEWTYRDLADDFEAIADAHRASRAVGVSLGAGALTRLVTAEPARFERLVFFLPAVLDRPRPAPAQDRFAAMLAALEAGDEQRLASVVELEVPPAAAGSAAARAYVRQRVAALQRPGVADQLRRLPGLTAVDSAEALQRVATPALVVGCHGDPLHPAGVAERLAAALPNADLHLYPEPGILWTRRAELRTRLSTFLSL